MRLKSGLPTRIAVIYGLFSLAWIAGSDRLLALFTRDPELLTHLQTAKGFAFVLASAVLIFALVRIMIGRLEESERRYRLLFEVNPRPMWLCDATTRQILDVNQAALRHYGYGRPEFLAMNLDELEAADRRRNPRHPNIRRHRRQDGSVIDVEMTWEPFLLAGRNVVIEVAEDVTERLRTQADLSETLNRLQRTNAELRDVSRAAAHDLQEPLRMVVSYVQLLDRRFKGHLGPEADGFIAFAVEGAMRMKRLVDDIQDYTQTVVYEHNRVDMNRVWAEAKAELAGAIGTAGARIEDGALPEVQGDHQQLVLLFWHLLDNALKFRHPERIPLIAISAERQTSLKVKISIRDNGLGMPSESLERIFALFHRLHAREKYFGTGIGLSLCRKIVDQHEGRIWAESQEGEGSTFHVILPSADEGPSASATH